MTSYRAALIGCGKIGSEFASDPRVRGVYTHAGAYAVCSATELVAICDKDFARLRACGGRWGIDARFGDAGEMLEQVRPDIVSICSPDDSHAALIGMVLDHGVKAIVAEKPLALDPHVAADLVQRARGLGTVLVVNYTRRYAEGHVRVSELIHAGALGEIQSVTGYYTKGVAHNGTHWFDLARFFFGDAVAVAAADVVGDRAEESMGSSADPTLSVTMRFGTGLRAHLIGCGSAFTIFEMDILGTAGRVRLTDSGHMIELFGVAESQHYSGYQTLRPVDSWDGGLHAAMPRLIENVVRCLRGEATPVCSGQDGVAALRIASAARESVLRRGPVSL